MTTFNVDYNIQPEHLAESIEAWDAIHPIPMIQDPEWDAEGWDGEGEIPYVPQFASRKAHIESILADYLMKIEQKAIHKYHRKNSIKLTRTI